MVRWWRFSKIFFIFAPNFGERRSNLTWTYFSIGLVQPPPRWMYLKWFWWTLHRTLTELDELSARKSTTIYGLLGTRLLMIELQHPEPGGPLYCQEQCDYENGQRGPGVNGEIRTLLACCIHFSTLAVFFLLWIFAWHGYFRFEVFSLYFGSDQLVCVFFWQMFIFYFFSKVASQLMVNWWLVAWIPAIPIGILRGTESQTTGPQITNLALVELHSPVFFCWKTARRLWSNILESRSCCSCAAWCSVWARMVHSLASRWRGAKGMVGMVEKVHWSYLVAFLRGGVFKGRGQLGGTLRIPRED